jgi:hypothetical protein
MNAFVSEKISSFYHTSRGWEFTISITDFLNAKFPVTASRMYRKRFAYI